MRTRSKPSRKRVHERNGHAPANRLRAVPAAKPAPPSLPLDAVADGAHQNAPDAPADACNGRGKAGKFAPGNKIGRGNPHARRMAEMRNALTAAMTPEKMAALGERLYGAAIAGDWVAAKLLLAYTPGLVERGSRRRLRPY